MEKAVTCSVYLINKRQEVSNDTERERSQSPGIIQYVCCMQNIKNTNIILIQGHRHPHIIKSPHLFSSSVLLIKGNRLCSTTLGMRRSSGRQSRVDFTAGASLLWQRGSLVGAAQVCGLTADSVGLVGTVLDRVVALGDTVVVFCAADHFG